MQNGRPEQVKSCGNNRVHDHRKHGVEVHHLKPAFCPLCPLPTTVIWTGIGGVTFFDAPVIVIHDFITADTGNAKSAECHCDHPWVAKIEDPFSIDPNEWRISCPLQENSKRNQNDRCEKDDHHQCAFFNGPVIAAVYQKRGDQY
jgi:hypothetical protein